MLAVDVDETQDAFTEKRQHSSLRTPVGSLLHVGQTVAHAVPQFKNDVKQHIAQAVKH